MRVSALVPLLLTAIASAGGGPLPFIEDDYARALREAREKNLPIFVEVWAPW